MYVQILPRLRQNFLFSSISCFTCIPIYFLWSDEKCQIKTWDVKREIFFHIVQIKIYQWIKKKKNLLLLPLHSRSPLQRPCNSSFHCVWIIDLPSNFLKGSWAPQGQDILSFEEKKKPCSKEMFIFLPFVQFMLLTARKLFPEEDA